MPTTVYPPAPPTIAGNLITVDAFLRDVTRVTRVLNQLTYQRFIADEIFAMGPPAPGGAVIYDQVLASDLFTTRDAQAITPGSEFPIIDEAAPSPLVALTLKWGGSGIITYEARDRDRRDVLGNVLRKLRNTIIRKVDTVAIAALEAAPIITQAGSGDWTTQATRIQNDIETARLAIDESDMGYEADTVLVNPAQVFDIRVDDDLRAARPRENLERSAVYSKDLTGLLGLDWIRSNRVTAGTAYVMARKQAGSISDEKPLYSRVVDEETRERLRVMAARVAVPYVTDPKAVVKITGI